MFARERFLGVQGSFCPQVESVTGWRDAVGLLLMPPRRSPPVGRGLGVTCLGPSWARSQPSPAHCSAETEVSAKSLAQSTVHIGAPAVLASRTQKEELGRGSAQIIQRRMPEGWGKVLPFLPPRTGVSPRAFSPPASRLPASLPDQFSVGAGLCSHPCFSEGS